MNKQLLKEKALALEEAFIEYSKLSGNIKRLSLHHQLTTAIADAKNETIDEPRRIQLNYWWFETDIQSYPEFADSLAEFCQELKNE